MPRQTSFISLAALDLDAAAGAPLYRQLYDQLRGAILAGRLRAGVRLPPSRALAAELAVSRNTVVNAFDQLAAEGYIVRRVGSGAYVAADLPDEAASARPSRPRAPRPRPLDGLLSRRGVTVAATTVEAAPESAKPRPFRPGTPALDLFPVRTWARLTMRLWRHARADLLGYGDAAGYLPLREAIAEYLGASRGVVCAPEQVIMVGGSQQAIDLAVRLLADPGDAAWLEDPGYLGARNILNGAGTRICPVPVDAEGLDVRAGIARAPDARIVYVSPSHQFPLGVTMSLPRRLALLEWAARAGAWVLEDDYDSEYRYTGRPLAALQGLDRAGRVIYIGTFSKMLFPSLRLGYLVAPPDLAATFRTARALADRQSPLVDQAVLTAFMREGHFARHIRKMRTLYAQNQAALVDSVARELEGRLSITGAAAGMHVLAWLPPGADDRAVSSRLLDAGIEAPPLSQYALGPLTRGGLVLGYAGLTPRQIRDGVRRMRVVLAAH
ncbi:MAG: PLP-dependent aminotransferase family protein [Chloroflexi bacterium]|nr:PLP-dependent aminotransferase family protein [Chloroflexota bacterium]